MILDNEKQRSLLLQLLNAINIPGSAIDEAYQLKRSIMEADISQEQESSVPRT